KLYLAEQTDGLVPIDLWDYKTAGTTDEAGQEIKSLFGSAVFDTPKPTKLIQKIIGIGAKSGGIVLDFFSGSASVGHAVFTANLENEGKINFILVQLPEPCEGASEAAKLGLKTIADIGKERLRRAIKNITSTNGQQLDF